MKELIDRLNSENDPLIQDIRQMLVEGVEFHTSIRDAVKRDNIVSARANLRLLLERGLCARQFSSMDDSMNCIDWENWSMAKLSKQLSDIGSKGLVNPEYKMAYRELAKNIRHWNRIDGKDRQMNRPSKYEWNMKIDSNFKHLYSLWSTYVHPTYRGECGMVFDQADKDYILVQSDLYIYLILSEYMRVLWLLYSVERGLVDSEKVGQLGIINELENIVEKISFHEGEDLGVIRKHIDQLNSDLCVMLNF